MRITIHNRVILFNRSPLYNMIKNYSTADLKNKIQAWSHALGFQQMGITDLNLSQVEPNLREWLAKQHHGEMQFIERHLPQRLNPQMLLENAQRALVVRMDYLPQDPQFEAVFNQPLKANISRYAQNKDYHKLIRKRLSQLADKITEHVGHPVISRAFADSAPVLEKPLAVKAGLGWQGKHTNLINPKAGSWFFLGVLYIDLPLPIDEPFQKTHCGTCTACIDVCPTQAIVGPYQLDARRCISYLTIELKGSIPEEFRPLIGNRIYGCDDCQLVCPWNKFAKASSELAFQNTRGFATPDLVELFAWTEAEFLQKTEGSPIRRIGYERWLRNIAVALGNAPKTPEVVIALESRLNDGSALVREHVIWALNAAPSSTHVE